MTLEKQAHKDSEDDPDYFFQILFMRFKKIGEDCHEKKDN